MGYNNLPGVIVNTIDGGLTVRRAPSAKTTLIIGVSDKGIADQPYQVVDRAKAAAEFGLNGNLVRSMEEASAYSDNVILFRMGTKAATLSGVGKEYAATSKAITNVGRSVTGLVTIIAVAHGYTTGQTVKTAPVTNVSCAAEAVITVVDATTYNYQTSTLTLIAAAADTGTSYSVLSMGVSITLGARSTDTATRYKIWYKTGVLAMFLDGNCVYSNLPGSAIDTGDLSISPGFIGALGLALGSGASPLLAGAVTLAALPVGTVTDPQPLFVAAVTGTALTMTGRQSYLAFLAAATLLDGFQVEQICVPDAKFDAPNIGFFVPADVTTAVNNPLLNPDALDFLKTVVDPVGNKTYMWASEALDSNGAVTIPQTFASYAARQTAGYYEQNWGYAIAKFCANTSKLTIPCISFIGTSLPRTFKLVDVRAWVGFLPTLDVNGKVVAPGSGLLGIPYAVGTVAGKLNPACKDALTGRTDGFFETAEGEYDGTANFDKNQNVIDIGAYIHVVADLAIMSNGWQRNYVANITSFVAGFCSLLDEKSALTNKGMNLTQIPGLVYIPGQLDSLTQAGINVLRNKGAGNLPALLHDMTQATPASDYTTLTRQRIKGRVVATLLLVGDPFIGQSSLDGLQLQALKTALDAALVTLNQRGYISKPSVVISSTPGETRIGHATLDLVFCPADELIQLNANVGLTR